MKVLIIPDGANNFCTPTVATSKTVVAVNFHNPKAQQPGCLKGTNSYVFQVPGGDKTGQIPFDLGVPVSESGEVFENTCKLWFLTRCFGIFTSENWGDDPFRKCIFIHFHFLHLTTIFSCGLTTPKPGKRRIVPLHAILESRAAAAGLEQLRSGEKKPRLVTRPWR